MGMGMGIRRALVLQIAAMLSGMARVKPCVPFAVLARGCAFMGAVRDG
jgi:hypothetical protein